MSAECEYVIGLDLISLGLETLLKLSNVNVFTLNVICKILPWQKSVKLKSVEITEVSLFYNSKIWVRPNNIINNQDEFTVMRYKL